MENRPDSQVGRAADAFRGFRLWRVVDGNLLSQTNDTVWPRDHALEATVHTGRAYWGLVGNGVYLIPIALFTSSALMAILVIAALEDIAETGNAPQWLANIANHSTFSGAAAGLLAACLCWAFSFGYPLLRSYLAKRTGNVVIPGESTPGIFAMKRLVDVEDDYIFADATQMAVRGSVWLWGGTIEHERGVKGEFAYPDTILDVSCVGCFGWVPIEQYVDESRPPKHPDCGIRSSMSLDKWGPAGLAELQATAPQWFESTKAPHVSSPIAGG